MVILSPSAAGVDSAGAASLEAAGAALDAGAADEAGAEEPPQPDNAVAPASAIANRMLLNCLTFIVLPPNVCLFQALSRAGLMRIL